MRPGLFAVTVLTVMLGLPSDGFACACVRLGNHCERLIQSDAVFEATVAYITPQRSTIRPAPFDEELLVQLVDVRHLRGATPNALVVAAKNNSCSYDFQIGRRYFIDGNRRADGQIETGPCSLTRPIEEASHLARYVQALDGNDERGRVVGRVHVPGVALSSNPRSDLPIGGAQINIRGPQNRSALSTPDGSFTIEGLLPGTYQVSVELLEEYRSRASVEESVATLDTKPFACAEVSLSADIDSRIAGVVTDGAGVPLGNVFVQVLTPEMLLNPWFAAGRASRTNETGHFEVTGLPPGRYIVVVNPWSGPREYNPFKFAVARSTDNEVEFTLGIGQHLEVPAIKSERLAPFRLEGVVSTADGTSRAGLAVRAFPTVGHGPAFPGRAVTTDADGRFVVNTYRGAPLRIVVGDPNAPLGSMDIVAGSGPVVISVRP